MLPGLLSAAASFLAFRLTTHPKSRINRSAPTLRILNLEFLPSIKIHFNQAYLHIHHWIWLSLFLIVSVPLDHQLIDSPYTRGYLIGGILQGLMYHDRRRILIRRIPETKPSPCFND